ncbi:DNA ligase (ATP) [Microbotryomycetes sp. JL201]|nr:DNA ligase (ATP) [Microbotryomycetes sp. JL201]
MSSQGDVEPGDFMRDSQDAADKAEPAEAQPTQVEKPQGIEDFGPAPKFGSLAHVLNAIERRRGDATFKKQTVLSDFFKRWRSEVGPDLHPVVRLLLPERDNRRRTYALKEQKLAKALVTALELPPESDAAKKLINWKVPTEQDPRAGEFSSVAYEVIKSRSTVVTSIGIMDIHDVNKALDDLSRVSYRGRAPKGFSPQEQHARILRECLGRMTAIEMKWLVRIILRDLKIGMSERVVLGVLHVDAIDMFNKCSDILQVCWKLHDPDYRLPREDKQIHVGHAFVPMLCFRSKRDLGTVVRFVTSDRPASHTNPDMNVGNQYFCKADEFLIEEKLDGERIQLHMQGSEFKYWSRKTKDYTREYGPNRHSGSLTPFIYDCFDPDIQELVLDGEMLVWEPSTQKYMAFGQLKSHFTRSDFAEYDPRPCFKVFDVLYAKTSAGTKCFLDIPLFRRKQFLKNIMKEKKGIFELAICHKGSSTNDITKWLRTILEERGEGLVIKNASAIYELASRGTKWIKVKPDYMDALGESVTARVIGGYWGQGNRGGFHASFLLGVCKTKADAQMPNPRYLSFAKVGSGFKLSDYERIKEQQGGKWFNYDRKNLPDWVDIIADWPDQLIHPDDSFVVTVKAAEITPTRDYATHVTLRFPRRKSEKRADSEAAAAATQTEDTLDDILQKSRNAANKHALSHDLSEKKKKAKTSRTIKKAYISYHPEHYEVQSNIFEGMVFYVYLQGALSRHRSISKQELEQMIEQNGGRFIQKIPDPSENRAVISASLKGEAHDLRTELRSEILAIFTGISSKSGAKKGECDILKPDWVLDSIANGRKMPLRKKYYVYATSDTMESPEYEDLSGEEEEEMESSTEPRLTKGEESYEASHYNMVEDPVEDQQLSDPEDERVRRDQAAESDDDEADEPETENEDDWRAEPSHRTASSLRIQGGIDAMGLTDAKPGLGAGMGEMHYDAKDLFKYLLFYIDTERNGQANGLISSIEKCIAEIQLLDLRDALARHGGRLTNSLSSSDLTHIIMNPSPNDRYKEILHKTSEPRYRQIVVPEWIHDSIEADTLVDEDAYRP